MQVPAPAGKAWASQRAVQGHWPDPSRGDDGGECGRCDSGRQPAARDDAYWGGERHGGGTGRGSPGKTPFVAAMDDFFARSAKSATHNDGSDEVVLGRYVKDSLESYDVVARMRGATYFSMGNWGAVSGEIGDAQMWSINKSFLDQQVAQGKTFLFTSDPSNAPVGTFTNKEFGYLSSKGYTVIPDEGGMYRAVK